MLVDENYLELLKEWFLYLKFRVNTHTKKDNLKDLDGTYCQLYTEIYIRFLNTKTLVEYDNCIKAFSYINEQYNIVKTKIEYESIDIVQMNRTLHDKYKCGVKGSNGCNICPLRFVVNNCFNNTEITQKIISKVKRGV